MLDVYRRCLTLPDSKTGAKVIALPNAAVDLILGLPRLAVELSNPKKNIQGPILKMLRDRHPNVRHDRFTAVS